MGNLADSLLPPQPDTDGLLGRTISRIRWVVIAVLLILAVAQPLATRVEVPDGIIVLAFAGYNLTVDLLRKRVPWLGSFAHVAFLDLPIAALIYWLGLRPSGPFFSLLVLTLFSSAASTTLRGSLLCTAAMMLIVAAIMPTFPLWSPNEDGIRELAARLLTLGVVGIATSMLMHQLRLEQESAQASRREAERLSEMDNLRRAFFSMVSHELRTPLTALGAALGMLETSTTGQLRPEQQGLISNARRNSERLRVLIDDLLTLSRLEVGALELVREPMDLRRIATEATSSMQALLEAKGQPLGLDLPEPLPVEGDRRRLEQVVVNLLHNAHVHTPPRTRIAVSGRATEREVLLSVRDEGPGIPEEDLETVFRPFHRLDPFSSGSGLGLAIAKGIVEHHGGRIMAESGQGRGTTIRLALPRRLESHG